MQNKKRLTHGVWACLLTLAMVCALLPWRVAEEPAQMAVVSDARYEQGSEGATYGQTREAEDPAVLELRQKMKERQETITVTMQVEDPYQDWGKWIFEQALAHTGEPTEGDYLRWHFYTRAYKTTRYQMGDAYYAEVTYTMTYYTTLEQEQELSNKIQTVLDELDLYDATEYEKICGIYDYICTHVKYDFENMNNWDHRIMFTAYAAMVQEKAVCQGYATLFYRMALALGLDARLIGGDSGGPHAWNIVRIGDQYYNIDSTWDSNRMANNLPYAYLLRGAALFEGHTRWEDYTTPEYEAMYPMSIVDYGFDPAAEENRCGENLSWELNADGTLRIFGTGDMDSFSEADQAPWYAYRQFIETVVVEAGVTSVGSAAFDGCENLSVVYLPQSVQKVENAAFSGSTALWHLLYAGTQEQWHAMGNEDLKDVAYHCGDVDLEDLNVQERHCAICVANCAHQWGEGEIVKKSTCAEEGEALYACALCGASETRAIPTEEHDWNAATCTRLKTCRACSATEGELAPHNYGPWVTSKEATETEQGEKRHVCTKCGADEREQIPALGVKETEPAPTTQPTQPGDTEQEEQGQSTVLVVAIAVVAVAAAGGAVAVIRKKKA